MRSWIFVLVSCVPLVAQAGIYRCTEGGHITYSDTPCGAHASPVHIDPQTKGIWSSPLAVPHAASAAASAKQPKQAKRSARSQDECQRPPSTELRSMLIEHQVVPCMTADEVMKAADHYAIFKGARKRIEREHRYTTLSFIPHDGPFPRSVFLVDGVVDNATF